MVLCAVAWTHCGFIVGLESGSVKGEIGGEKESKLNHWTILQFETKFGRFSFLKDIKKLRISNLNYWIGILLYVFFFYFSFVYFRCEIFILQNYNFESRWSPRCV